MRAGCGVTVELPLGEIKIFESPFSRHLARPLSAWCIISYFAIHLDLMPFLFQFQYNHISQFVISIVLQNPMMQKLLLKIQNRQMFAWEIWKLHLMHTV